MKSSLSGAGTMTFWGRARQGHGGLCTYPNLTRVLFTDIMPRNYKKKGPTRKFQYDPVFMERALAAVTNGRMSIKACEMYAVPYTTLQRKYCAGERSLKIGGQPVLSEIEERKLVDCLLLCVD